MGNDKHSIGYSNLFGPGLKYEDAHGCRGLLTTAGGVQAGVVRVHVPHVGMDVPHIGVLTGGVWRKVPLFFCTSA